MKSRKASNVLSSAVVYLILTVAFFSIVFFFVLRSVNGTSTLEEIYSKQICLIVDSMRPGTEVNLDFEALYEKSKKNNYLSEIFLVDYENNLITIRLDEDKGHSCKYYNTLYAGYVDLDEKNRRLIIKF